MTLFDFDNPAEMPRKGEEAAVAETAPHLSKYVSLGDVLARDNIQSAWERVRRNQGCAGVDGVTITELQPNFTQQWVLVERAICSGTYTPRPLLRVRIPKRSGGERLLGIPTVIDRVVQQALAQALSVQWEPRFSCRSFAYRPARGPRDALTAFEHSVATGAYWVLHLDIQDFFDSVPHAVVLARLDNAPTDQKVIALVRKTLACGVYEDGVVVGADTKGLAQGSPLSPLLANIVLDLLDARLQTEGWEFVRYADDCVVLLPHPDLANTAKLAVEETLAGIGLRLNEQKTNFRHFTETRFLGFAFCRDGHGRPIRCVSPEALAEAETSLLQTLRSASSPDNALAASLAETLRGWLAYFHTSHDEPALRDLVQRICAAWKAKFPGTYVPPILSWPSVCTGVRQSGHVDYSGHLANFGTKDSHLNWAETWRCLLDRLLHSHRWHLEYDLDWQSRPRVRLCIGHHRINLRF